MKLGLGTVQFGCNYGISNHAGQVNAATVANILSYAQSADIDLLDTAQAYGESETILGSQDASKRFKIITKLKASDQCHIESALLASLSRLQASCIDGVLLHDADSLLSSSGEILYQQLSSCRAAGLVRKIGVSVYTREQITQILSRFEIDLIQLPINIFDQRLLTDDYLANLKRQDIEIHVRSIYLQGLIFMDPAQLAGTLARASTMLHRFQQVAADYHLSPAALAMAFTKQVPGIDYIIVGCTSVKELRETVNAFRAETPALDFAQFAIEDETILNPANW